MGARDRRARRAQAENPAANPDVEFRSKWNGFLRDAGGVPLREGIGIAIAPTVVLQVISV
jgi:hypothetical protein